MNKVIFLDRDGTINVDTGEVFKIENWEFTKNCINSLFNLKKINFKLAIVTNQRKIAEGLCTEKDVQTLHKWLQQQIPIDAIAYCPHPIEAHCKCRKPEIGMVKQIEDKLGKIDYQCSWMIGDKPSDMEFGKTIGVKTILIRNNYVQTDKNADYIVANLNEASFLICHY